MKNAYLETNAINQALKQSISGKHLKKKLEDKDLIAKFGIHGIYELARTFLNENNAEIGVSLFKILRDLKPSYQPTTQMLLKQEIIKLRTGAAVIPILDTINQAATKQEVDKLARGVFDNDAKAFIAKRESDIKHSHPKMSNEYIKKSKEAIKNRSKSTPPLRTFDQVFSELESQIPDVIYQLLNRKVSKSESRELHLRLNQFPVIRSTVMANIYLTSICIIHGSVPGKDKIDDYRHIIEASYCDYLITSDSQLVRTVPRINPKLQAIYWHSLN